MVFSAEGMNSPLNHGIYAVRAGAWPVEEEWGGYYFLCKLGVWIEFQTRLRPVAGQEYGARWSIDRWASHRDAPAFLKHSDGAPIWRIEIEDVITTGWRDGSIGGPNGEQPSSNRWILWGNDKHSVKCLSPGIVPPSFEFALFLKHQENVHWENNRGRNFSLSLNHFF